MATTVIVASNNNSVVQLRQNKSIVTSTTGTATADPIARETASSAYDKANSANVLAQSAYNYANTLASGSSVDSYARSKANTANVIAQSAYDFANTLSGGPVSLDGGSF
jgi:hypothetical protein